MAILLALPAALGCGLGEDPLDEIRALHEQGKYRPTVDRLRRLVDEDPSRHETQLLLGVALLGTGESGLAVWPLRRATESPEYAVRAGLLLTEALLRNRSAADAVKAADRVLALEPDHVNALALRMQGYLATARLEEAMADIERVLELDPEHLAIRIPRVTTLIAMGRIEEAEAELAATRELFDTTSQEVTPGMRARLCIANGLFAFEKGDPKAAEEQYETCLEEFPEEPLAIREAVDFYDQLGRPERATEILKAAAEGSGGGRFRVALARRLGALGDLEEQERLMREEAEERSTALAWFAVADLYAQREDFDAALGAFERALAAEPEPSAKLRFAYADTLAQAGRYDEARELAEGLEQPELRDLVLGRILLGQGDPEGALRAFEAGIRLWPNNAGARFLAGQAAERIGDFDRAESEYRESTRAGAGQTEAGRELAPLYALQKDYDAALDVLGRYLRAYPRDPEAVLLGIRIGHAAGRHDIAAQGLERLAQMPGYAATAVAEEAELVALGPGPEQALRAFERVGLDLRDPANLAALRKRVSLLGDLGRHGEARQGVARALAEHPDEAAFHAVLGAALARAGDAAGARRAFERALELDPGHGPALVGLGALVAEAGERDAALALYARAAEADPEDAAAALSAARLEREAGRGEGAEERLVALLARRPREGEAALELARLLEEKGELERAVDYASRAAWLRTPESQETLARLQQRREEGGLP